MKAIRGATTVSRDNPEQIQSAVKELLNTIVRVNNVGHGQIICIMFSSTADLKSFYPAKAAREAGFASCALYSSLEPEIEGSLERCIRVMLLVEGDFVPEHVYLNEAKNLRKDLTSILNVAVDGPAGSGKSTIAKIIAKKFDILYLDTGATYRAVIGVKSVIAVDISVKYKNGAQVTLMNNENVSDKIRVPEISMLASTVSAHKFVRDKMVALQRAVAADNSCVLDGRDIGTNVLPDAEFKFFLTASPEVRAGRRFKENLLKGINQPYEEVLKEIKIRDAQDFNRKFAPLVKAADAVEVDTGDMTIDEVAACLIGKIQRNI